MSTETKPQPGYIPRDRAWQPPALAPAYKTSITRSPQQALLSFPTTLTEESGPVFGHFHSRFAGQQPAAKLCRRWRQRNRPAHSGVWAGSRPVGTGCARCIDRSLAGECRWSLSSSKGNLHCTAGPQFWWLRSLFHGRSRLLRISQRSSGRLSVAE